jgi:hypothetical protein
VAICVFIVTAAILGWARSGGASVLNVEIAFNQSACCDMQVWVNDPGPDVVVFPIQGGTTHVYSTPFSASRIDKIRMPVGQSPANRLVIRRIWVSQGSRVVEKLDAAELRRVLVPSGAKAIPDPGGAAFQAVDSSPFLTADVAMDTNRGPVRVFLTKVTARTLPTIVFLLVAGALLTAVVGFAAGRQSAAMAAMAGMVAILVVLPWLIPNDGFRDPVDMAIGSASYNGVSKFRQQLLFALTVAGAALVPVIAVFAAAKLRRRRRAQPPSAAESVTAPDEQSRLSRRASVALAAVPGVIALVGYVPNLGTLAAAGRAAYEPSWDTDMVLFWKFLLNETELVPVKDYFWPYGFRWLSELPVPLGPLLGYATYASFWGLVGIGSFTTLSRFFSGSSLVARSLLLSALPALALLAGYGRFDSRYVAPTALVLLFAGIRDGERLLSWRRLLFAFALVGVTLFEPAQAMYALPAIVVLASARVWLDQRERAPKQLLTQLATVATPIAATAAVLAATDTLNGTIDWYAAGRALNSAYAFPKPIDSWAHAPSDVSGFVYWAVPMGICLGMFSVVARRGRARSLGCVVVALGLASVVLMQK